MKYPVTLALALPILFIVSGIVDSDGKSVSVTIVVLGLMFLTEIRIKYGNLSWSTIKQFFNTPIQRGGVVGNPPVDKSPKVSLISGTLIILGGTVIAVCVLGLYFSLTQ